MLAVHIMLQRTEQSRRGYKCFSEPHPSLLSAAQGPSPRFAAFIAAPSAFDAAAFGITLPEAVLTDPQQRLLLESVTEAMPGAAASTSGQQQRLSAVVGVFLGIAAPDYAGLAQAHSGIGPYGATGMRFSHLMSACSCVIKCIICFAVGNGTDCCRNHDCDNIEFRHAPYARYVLPLRRLRSQCGVWTRGVHFRLHGACCGRRFCLLVEPGRRPPGTAQHASSHL